MSDPNQGLVAIRSVDLATVIGLSGGGFRLVYAVNFGEEATYITASDLAGTTSSAEDDHDNDIVVVDWSEEPGFEDLKANFRVSTSIYVIYLLNHISW